MKQEGNHHQEMGGNGIGGQAPSGNAKERHNRADLELTNGRVTTGVRRDHGGADQRRRRRTACGLLRLRRAPAVPRFSRPQTLPKP